MPDLRGYFAMGVLLAAVFGPLAGLFGHADARSAPMTDGPVQPRLAWFYKPPINADPATLAREFDFFVFTKTDEPVRDAVRAAGSAGPFIQYLLLTEVVDPQSCWAQPWRNQVTDRVGDYCMLAEQHPDWFLRDVNGNMITHEPAPDMRYVMMDPGHPGWRAFWLERAMQMQAELGYDGVFLDNVEASLGKLRSGGQLPAAYPDDASYQRAVAGFLEYLHTQYFGPQGRLLYANVIVHKGTAGVWERYLQYLDGAMDEAWSVDWNDAYLSAEDWLTHLDLAERTQALGKDILLVAQGTQDDYNRQEFAYVSYLLADNGRAYFRYADARDAYNQMWLYANYDLDLGEPLGAHECLGELVCWRAFEHASAWVMPGALSAGIITY